METSTEGTKPVPGVEGGTVYRINITKMFMERWLSMLWAVMMSTGDGYRKPKQDRITQGLGRREDKKKLNKTARRLRSYGC